MDFPPVSEAKLEFCDGGIYLRWPDGPRVGPFSTLAAARDFLDDLENRQRSK